MSQPFVGQVVAVGFNFAPQGWLLCQGQLLPISQYDVLFALIGTTYGGNGTTNFALPDLRSRVPLSMGQGPGLANYVLGQSAGTENVTLNQTQIPPHTHNPIAATPGGTTATPANNTIFAALPAGRVYGNPVPAPPAIPTPLAPSMIPNSGGSGSPHSNVQPLQTVNYIIAWAGIFPSA
jgi:microcystin-dependent protein